MIFLFEEIKSLHLQYTEYDCIFGDFSCDLVRSDERCALLGEWVGYLGQVSTPLHPAPHLP